MSLEDEYKKNKEITPQDIDKLKQWLKTQPHLPEEYITDLDLILIFHCCNCSSAVAKELIDVHYTLKTLFTSFFKDRRFDENAKKQLDVVLLTPLPTRTKEGYVVFYTHLINTNPKAFDFEAIVRVLFMIIDVIQYQEGTWPGLIFAIDFEGVSWSHVTKLDVAVLRQTMYFLQEALLLQLKGIHFLNAPNFIDKVLLLIKPLVKKELFDAICIHTVGSKTLDKLFPVSSLPKDYGGEHKTVEECKKEIIQKLQDNIDFINNENKKRVNEALRPGKQKTISDIFGGVEGSFKKLDID